MTASWFVLNAVGSGVARNGLGGRWKYSSLQLGLVPAYIAQKKGRSFVGWWIYGALLFIVALPHALIMDPLPDSEEAMKHDALVRTTKGLSPVKQNGFTVARQGSDERTIIKRGLYNL